MEDRKEIKRGELLKKKIQQKQTRKRKIPIFENDTFEVLHQEE